MAHARNLLVVLADQWRGQDQGWTGESGVTTPNLDRLAAEGVAVERAYANFPVCCPSRASLLTGELPTETGVIANDLPIREAFETFGDMLRHHGLETGWIGNWHLHGMPREQWVPPDDRGGFTRWASAHCSHRHNDGGYFTGDDHPERVDFTGYEPEVLGDLAEQWIRESHAKGKDFAYVLSLAPPHDPYDTVPDRYRRRYTDSDIVVRDNADDTAEQRERQRLYWAAISAVDDQIGRLTALLDELGLRDDTLVVVTADHGDMLGSHGLRAKQMPYAESVRVPLVMRWPRGLPAGHRPDGLFGLIDLPSTILRLLGQPRLSPDAYGRDLSKGLRGKGDLRERVFLANYVSFDNAYAQGIPSWRGFVDRTRTYARSAGRPWLLFDDVADPWQHHNLVGDPDHTDAVREANRCLEQLLVETRDPGRSDADLIHALGLIGEWNTRESGLHGDHARLIDAGAGREATR